MRNNGFKIDVQVTSCSTCPSCIEARHYDGGDGRNDRVIYICSKGAYGKKDNTVGRYYTEGYDSKPNEIHPKCPFVEFDILDKCNLEISYKK